MIKVVVADEIEASGLEPLSGNGAFKLVHVKNAEELAREIGDADALLVRSKTKVNASVIASGPKLRFLGRAGVGVDNIDVPSASKRGIVVANVPGGNTISAAEHTVALMLALSRNIPQSHASVRSGLWERSKFVGTELQGKALGLLGFGRIGREVAKRANAFEMRVSAHDPFVSEAHMKSNNVAPATFEKILSESDFISIHLPVTPETKNILNDAAFARMRPECRLINCARGELVDEAALIAALKARKIKGAALDVYRKEPPEKTELFALDGVILTPHLGASTEEAQVKVAYELSLSLKDFFQKGLVRNAVNLPSIDPELLEKGTPHIRLAEKLGRFIVQISEGGIQEIRVEYSGDFATALRNILTLTVVKGVLSKAMAEREINWISAIPIAQERGIRVDESATTESQDFTILLTVTVKTDRGTRSVSGTILSQGAPRVVRIDDLSVDVQPEGHLLVFTNVDRPGVVGFIGTILGENKINIAQFQVGRKTPGGEAVSILMVDSPIPAAVLEKIRAFPGITRTWLVSL